MIDEYGVLVNNKLGRSTWLISQKTLIIDLVLSTTKLGLLTLWKIPEEYLALSNYELILLR